MGFYQNTIPIFSFPTKIIESVKGFINILTDSKKKPDETKMSGKNF